MMNYYDTLFTIECRHAYYRDDVCPDLEIVPTDECRKILRSHGLLFRSRNDGALIIREKKNTGTETAKVWEPVAEISPGTVFTFCVSLRNPYFLNITDVDQSKLKPSSVVLFSSELVIASSSSGDTKSVVIHDGPIDPTSQSCESVAKAFRAPVDDSSIVTLAICDESGHELFRSSVESGQGSVPVDLTGYPEAVYEIRQLDSSDGEVAKHKVFASDAIVKPGVIAFIRIEYSSAVLAHAEPKHAFRLKFSSRSIRWTYKVDVGDSLNPNHFHLAGEPVHFSHTVDGKKISFASDDPIPLREEPYTGIQLKKGAGDPEILIKHMPNPDVRRLSKSGGELHSEMCISVK